MSKFIVQYFFLILICIATCFQEKVEAQEVVIKFATIAPEGTTWMKVMKALSIEIQEKTQNRVRFRVYSGMVAGDELDVIRKMRVGQFHGGGFTGVGLGVLLPEMRILELPFLFRNEDEIDFVVNQLLPYFYKKMENRGYVLLGWAEVGYVHLFSRNEIRDLKDIKGQKMWAWEGDPLAAATFKAFGINPIPLSIINVFTSLQTGLIDGFYTSPYAAVALQWYTKVKYMLDFPITNASGAVVITKRQFDRISVDDKKIVKDVARRHLRYLVEQTRKENQDAVEVIKNSGIRIISLEEEEVRKFQRTAENLREELKGNL